MKITTKKLVLSALMMALTMLATMFIRIPLPFGYVNLGDAFVLLSVFILGPVYGTIAAGVGSGFADLLGYITYAPGTLIIKSLMALIAYFIYKFVLKIIKKQIVAEFLAGIVGSLVMAFGYFFYEILLYKTSAVAINIPYNIIQGLVGTVIAVAVIRTLSKTKLLEKLQK